MDRLAERPQHLSLSGLARPAVEILTIVLAAVGLSCLIAALQAWRAREHRYDVALLAATGAGLGASALIIGA